MDSRVFLFLRLPPKPSASLLDQYSRLTCRAAEKMGRRDRIGLFWAVVRKDLELINGLAVLLLFRATFRHLKSKYLGSTGEQET